MKLGVHIGYWGLGLTSQDQLEIVQEAERLGYDSVWTAEAYGADALSPLAYLAALTSRIRLGCAVAQLAARPPESWSIVAAVMAVMAALRPGI